MMAQKQLKISWKAQRQDTPPPYIRRADTPQLYNMHGCSHLVKEDLLQAVGDGRHHLGFFLLID
jgi:hypothetical protein